MDNLEILYHSHKANCCKCGCTLSVYADEALGDYFVLDINGNFYCMNCDYIFDKVDDRIYNGEVE